MNASHALSLNACRAAFPERAGLSVEAVSPLESSHHPMLAVHLRAEGTPLHPLILRRYTSPLGWHLFEDTNRASRELVVLRWLGEQGFPVPPAHAAGADESGDWLLVGAVSGQNWWQPLGLVDFDRVLPGVVRQQVEWMARLHALDPAPLQASGAPLPVVTAAGVLETCRRAVRGDVRRDDDPAAVLAALERVTGLMGDDEERPARLVNMDAEVANVLVTPGGEVSAWLDWDEAALADPRWDVAALVNSLRGAYQMDELARRAVTQYNRETLRPARNLAAWVALYAVLRWAGCAWLKARIKAGHEVSFPSRDRFVAAYGSHRAWALEMLAEAEEVKDAE
jgi:aminoglycoside phosphotransferase (APT) family kinase protein